MTQIAAHERHLCSTRPLMRAKLSRIKAGAGMRRREFIVLASGAAAWWPNVARAQSERVRRIGVITTLDANDPEGQSEVESLKQGLQKLGWVEGRNLHVEYKWPGSEPDRIKASVTELVGLHCEVIVARSTPVMAALVKETRAIPIVFSYVADPIGSGFFASSRLSHTLILCIAWWVRSMPT
jgi:putative tryptophan/tyrosine transport system substrate-binding protein